MANYIPRLLIQPDSTPLKMRGGGTTNVYVQNCNCGGYNIGGYLNGGYYGTPVSMDSRYYNNCNYGGYFGCNNYMSDWIMKASGRSMIFSLLSGLFGSGNK